MQTSTIAVQLEVEHMDALAPPPPPTAELCQLEQLDVLPSVLPPPPPTTELCALPAGWSTGVDTSSGDTYYFNDITGESRWERPQ